MIRLQLKIVGASLLAAALLLACSPVEAQSISIQLPSTQPASTESRRAGTLSGSLPAGHPDISQTQTPNPSGAADSSAMPGGVNLPAGHPDISGLVAGDGGGSGSGPTSQPSAITGSMVIHAVQATAGGPAIAIESYAVELYIQGQLFNRIEGKLDEKGNATVDGIPMRLGLQPVVKVRHAGAEYEATAPVLNGMVAQPEVNVAVYETTDQQPEWSVRMRHVMVQRIEGGLQVMEMLAIENPGDRAWIGKPIEPVSGKRNTFTLTLPSEAQHVQLIGTNRDGIVIEGNRLTNTAPLVPGTTQYQIAYLLPAHDGKVDIAISAPSVVKNMMIFVPDDGTTVKAQGIESMGSGDTGSGMQRFYKGADLSPGQEVKIAISGIVDVARAAGSAAGMAGSTHTAQIVAGVGAVLILLFGAAFLFLKGPAKETGK